jgi:hypothetical protein
MFNAREQEAFSDEEEVNQRSVPVTELVPARDIVPVPRNVDAVPTTSDSSRRIGSAPSTRIPGSPHNAAVTESLQKRSQQSAKQSMSPVTQLIRRKKPPPKKILQRKAGRNQTVLPQMRNLNMYLLMTVAVTLNVRSFMGFHQVIREVKSGKRERICFKWQHEKVIRERIKDFNTYVSHA